MEVFHSVMIHEKYASERCRKVSRYICILINNKLKGRIINSSKYSYMSNSEHRNNPTFLLLWCSTMADPYRLRDLGNMTPLQRQWHRENQRR